MPNVIRKSSSKCEISIFLEDFLHREFWIFGLRWHLLLIIRIKTTILLWWRSNFSSLKEIIILVYLFDYISIIDDNKRWPLVRINLFVIGLIWDANHKVSVEDDVLFSNSYWTFKPRFWKYFFRICCCSGDVLRKSYSERSYLIESSVFLMKSLQVTSNTRNTSICSYEHAKKRIYSRFSCKHSLDRRISTVNRKRFSQFC